jgi:uncharacterized protein (TIGR02246 family)
MRTRTCLVIPILCALGCGGSADVGTSDTSSAADESAIREHTARFDAALNAQDIEAMMALYADDAVRMDPNLPAAIGKDGVRTLFLEAWELSEVEVVNSVSDVRISGGLASSRGTFTATVTPRDGGDPVEDRGKWSATYERQSDGTWRSIWEIWSSDLPAAGN